MKELNYWKTNLFSMRSVTLSKKGPQGLCYDGNRDVDHCKDPAFKFLCTFVQGNGATKLFL